MSLQQLYLTLLVGGLVVLVSIVATRVALRLGLPSLLLFLALGVVLGEDVLGIEFNDAQLAQDLGTAALAVILIEGGLTTDWSDIRSVIAPAGVLASAGVGLSTAVTAVGAHYLLAMGWQQAVLLGAILASTDAAAVFSVLRVLPLPRRVAGLLEAESGFNDAPSVVPQHPRRPGSMKIARVAPRRLVAPSYHVVCPVSAFSSRRVKRPAGSGVVVKVLPP